MPLDSIFQGLSQHALIAQIPGSDNAFILIDSSPDGRASTGSLNISSGQPGRPFPGGLGRAPGRAASSEQQWHQLGAAVAVAVAVAGAAVADRRPPREIAARPARREIVVRSRRDRRASSHGGLREIVARLGRALEAEGAEEVREARERAGEQRRLLM